MLLLSQILWAVAILFILAGALTYPFNKHLGLDLLKRSAVLLGVALLSPTVLSTAVADVPTAVLVLLGPGACLAAYAYVTGGAAKHQKHGHASSSHAERRPQVPHEHNHDESQEEDR